MRDGWSEYVNLHLALSLPARAGNPLSAERAGMARRARHHMRGLLDRPSARAMTGMWLLAVLALLIGVFAVAPAAAQSCAAMRKINVGVSVAPPNVVHTSPYIAKALGLFAARCIDATIIQFDGGA